MKNQILIENFDNHHQQVDSAQNFLNTNIKLEGEWLLEAGCGSLSRLKFPDMKLAGIDISQKQLDRNSLLTEKICGDLQTYPLEKNKFAVCICWDVFEHIQNPEVALANMCNSIKPNGYLFLALPNVRSLKGLVTQFTPYWFHVWYYKNILGDKDAGKEDTSPFKTFLNSSVSAPNIINALTRNGFNTHRIIYADILVSHLKKNRYALWLIYATLSSLLSFFTFGLLGGKNNSDFIVIAQKTVG